MARSLVLLCAHASQELDHHDLERYLADIMRDIFMTQRHVLPEGHPAFAQLSSFCSHPSNREPPIVNSSSRRAHVFTGWRLTA